MGNSAAQSGVQKDYLLFAKQQAHKNYVWMLNIDNQDRLVAEKKDFRLKEIKVDDTKSDSGG